MLKPLLCIADIGVVLCGRVMCVRVVCSRECRIRRAVECCMKEFDTNGGWGPEHAGAMYTQVRPTFQH